jgi:cold-inducible RNA-binding protein
MNQAKVYVGNLSYNTTEDELRDYFAQYGNIDDVKLISDYQTGRSKGFAFVTFASDQEGESALAANGVEFKGRKLNVNTAKDNNRRGGGEKRGGGGYHSDR